MRTERVTGALASAFLLPAPGKTAVCRPPPPLVLGASGTGAAPRTGADRARARFLLPSKLLN